MTTRGRILVVDDDRDIRETLAEALQDRGYAVSAAADGLDALDHLQHAGDLPDLILLDLMMPRMNGPQFRDELVRDDRWAHIPIVVISADARGHAHAAAMSAVAYLRKPMRLAELIATVAQHIAPPAAAP